MAGLSFGAYFNQDLYTFIFSLLIIKINVYLSFNFLNACLKSLGFSVNQHIQIFIVTLLIIQNYDRKLFYFCMCNHHHELMKPQPKPFKSSFAAKISDPGASKMADTLN